MNSLAVAVEEAEEEEEEAVVVVEAVVEAVEAVVERYFAICFGHVSRRIHVGAEGSSKHRKLRLSALLCLKLTAICWYLDGTYASSPCRQRL